MDFKSELTELATAVQKMRTLQNEYFKRKKTTTLFQAKEAERAVDVKIAAIFVRMDKEENSNIAPQGDLF